MLSKVINEFKEQPWKSTAALAGVASFFVATLESSGSFKPSSGGGIIFQFFVSILLSIGVASGFGFVGAVLSRTYNFNSQVLSLACIFMSALSAKAMFVYWFIWPNFKTYQTEFQNALYTVNVTLSTVFTILATSIYWGFYTKDLESDEVKAGVFILIFLLVVTAVSVPFLDLLSIPSVLGS